MPEDNKKSIDAKYIIIAIILFMAILMSYNLSNLAIIDPESFNNTTINTNVTGGISKDFYFEVASGNIEGYSSVNKFGHNPTSTTGGEDVWMGGGTYAFYPTTAQSMEIVSSSGLDDSAGIGARQVMVFGLDENWAEISETVSLSGTTPVNLQEDYIRMYRAIVLEVGTTESNVGDIEVRVQGGGTVGALIGAGDGQTQQAIYTIPINKTGYFIKGYVSLGNQNKNGEDGTFQWQARSNNGFTGAWTVKGQVALINIGSSHWQYLYGVPAGQIPEKTDIRIKTTKSSAIIDTVAGFDLVLVDNNILAST